MLSRRALVSLLVVLLGLFVWDGKPARAAATIVILVNDPAGAGFNDPTPAAPIGGNAGTTVGQQRLIAFQHAADIWGAQLTSVATITIRAQWPALTCTATTATLGSAGPVTVWRDFPGAPFSGTWYHAALANKLNGRDLLPPAADPVNHPEISANFNSNIGQPGCLSGTGWYYGLDNNHGTLIDLVTVLLHEFSHGLGFSTTTSGSTGNFFGGFPSAYDYFLLDKITNNTWSNITVAERHASAINNAGLLVWNGANTVNAVPGVLGPDVTTSVTAPATAIDEYHSGSATFGPPVTEGGLPGELMPIADQGTGPGCSPFNAMNTLAASGKIVMIDRGVCTFAAKVKNAQNAGAIGVIIANNAPGLAPGVGGSDSTITIPTLSLSQADADILKNALRFRSRSRSGVFVRLGISGDMKAGADNAGRPWIFAPSPFSGGLSISHWDSALFPNQLMEPVNSGINPDLIHAVTPPQDLTLRVLQDLGW
jgi:hypothetical protein